MPGLGRSCRSLTSADPSCQAAILASERRRLFRASADLIALASPGRQQQQQQQQRSSQLYDACGNRLLVSGKKQGGSKRHETIKDGRKDPRSSGSVSEQSGSDRTPAAAASSPPPPESPKKRQKTKDKKSVSRRAREVFLVPESVLEHQEQAEAPSKSKRFIKKFFQMQ